MIRGPQTWRTVPEEPTEEMWGGLARQMIMWARMGSEATGRNLHAMLKSLGMDRPNWLLQEIPDTDRVPSKGTVAACIYKAMLAVAPKPPE